MHAQDGTGSWGAVSTARSLTTEIGSRSYQGEGAARAYARDLMRNTSKGLRARRY